MNIISKNTLSYNNQLNMQKNAVMFEGRSKQINVMVDKFISKNVLTPKEQRSFVSILRKAIDNIILQSKNLGSGAYNTVYGITSKNSKFVLRVPHNINVKDEIKNGEVLLGDNEYCNMKDYFGEPVLNVGKIQILKNIGDAVVLGVPDKLAKTMNKEEIKEYFLNKYLPMISPVPQESFDKFVHEVNRLNLRLTKDGSYCRYDSINPNNTALTKNKEFVFVDEFLGSKYPDPNTATTVLEALMLNATKDVYAPFSEMKTDLYKTILVKIVKAVQNEGMRFTNLRDDYFLWNEALRLSGINKKGMDFINDLKSIRVNNSQEKWVEETDKYLLELFNMNK